MAQATAVLAAVILVQPEYTIQKVARGAARVAWQTVVAVMVAVMEAAMEEAFMVVAAVMEAIKNIYVYKITIAPWAIVRPCGGRPPPSAEHVSLYT